MAHLNAKRGRSSSESKAPIELKTHCSHIACVHLVNFLPYSVQYGTLQLSRPLRAARRAASTPALLSLRFGIGDAVPGAIGRGTAFLQAGPTKGSLRLTTRKTNTKRVTSADKGAMHGYMILPIFVSIAHDACEVSALFRHVLAACAGLCLPTTARPWTTRRPCSRRCSIWRRRAGRSICIEGHFGGTRQCEGEITGHGISDLLV